MVRKSVGGASLSSDDSKKKGSHGDSIPEVLQSLTSSPSSSLVVQVGTLPKFLINGEILLPNRCMLNMVEGHHLPSA